MIAFVLNVLVFRLENKQETRVKKNLVDYLLFNLMSNKRQALAVV
jgi:hypothetical protein